MEEQNTTQELIRTNKRQVEAIETGRPYQTIDFIDGKLSTRDAGVTRLVDYENGRAKGLQFIAADGGKEYALGNPSRKQTNHTIIDHPTVVSPILDAGFELTNTAHTAGDSSLFALFKHPDITMPDNISWDKEAYGLGFGGADKDTGLLHLSIATWISPRIGKSIRLAAGYFRTLCSNGLVSEILGMGSLKITHNSFSTPKLGLFAEDTIQKGNLEFETFSPKVLEYPLKMLDAFHRDEGMLESLPKFVQTPFRSALAGQSNFVQDEFAYQINLALESKQDLCTLDVLNMITNVNAAADNDSLMFKVETISQAFMSLLEISAFKSNLPFPKVITVKQ